MDLKALFTRRGGTKLAVMLLAIGIAILLFGISGSRSVTAADQVTINWGDITPDIEPDPDFVIDEVIGVENDTYFSNAANPHEDPYHGLGSAAGGVDGFSSQFFPNVADSGVDMTLYYSDNNYDGNILEGPDLYAPDILGLSPNPDRRVTGEYLIRVNRDHVGTRTPTTVVLVFSDPVFIDEYIIGSLSTVSGSLEHAIVRAFATADATGDVVKASGFVNISNLDTCATLILDQCVAEGPTPLNALANVAVDPDLTDGNNDGVYENVGSPADNGIYHIHGVVDQPDGYGRVKLVYSDLAIRSIAVSFFPTSAANPNPFTDTNYTDQWVSTIFAPHSFTPQDPTAISLSQSSVSVSNMGLILVGLALIVMAVISSFAFRRQSGVGQ